MKKTLVGLILLMLILSGCGNSKMVYSVEKNPDYKDGVASEFIVQVTEADEVVAGLNMVASLEMAKMDHGVIEVSFVDNGDGTYTADVELPMAGEWIADLRVDKDGKTFEEVLTFDVKES